ncbi:hypothetical protein JCM21900_004549 [Sporobolomyces salmonicolor]
MLLQAGADKSLWAEALLAFVFVKNHSPHAALKSKVPLAVWRGRPDRVDMLRVWGCRAWHTLSKTKSKLDARAVPLVFVGDDGETRAYRLLDPESKRIVRSCDTHVQKDLFPLTSASPPATADAITPNPPAALADDSPLSVTVVRDVPLDNDRLRTPAPMEADMPAAPPRAPAVDIPATPPPQALKSRNSPPPVSSSPQRMHIQQADVDQAYLHANHNKELYMRVPDGIDGPDWDGKVLKLDRALYSLKQAGRTWNGKIHATLEHLSSDICVYVRCEGGNYHYIALSVDDLLFLSHSQSEIDRVKGGLREQYNIKDLAYLETVLARLGQLECHTAPTPMIPNQQLIPAPPDSADDPSLRRRYLQAVGSLMYAMLGTRPDLAHSVGVPGHFSSWPSPVHWAAVVRVCQCIKGSLDIGLLYSPSDSPIGGFNAYSDSDWGACPTMSRSTMGFAFILAGGAISWSSRLQHRVTASSTEAEYLGLSHAGKEAIFLSQLLGELGLPFPSPLLLYGDNQGANTWARDPQFHNRTRHLRLTEHFVREMVTQGMIDV